ncbi:MAG: hypothetical protein SFY80_01865 [Verrucomicrobiota bacterium]|nr:hypothetical protein [Verrucomicrobiota bacterium]
MTTTTTRSLLFIATFACAVCIAAATTQETATASPAPVPANESEVQAKIPESLFSDKERRANTTELKSVTLAMNALQKQLDDGLSTELQKYAAPTPDVYFAVVATYRNAHFNDYVNLEVLKQRYEMLKQLAGSELLLVNGLISDDAKAQLLVTKQNKNDAKNLANIRAQMEAKVSDQVFNDELNAEMERKQ